MATQLDTLGSNSSRAFRPWRHRGTSPGQTSHGDGNTSAGITSARTGAPLSSSASSLSPSLPSIRAASGRRSQTHLSVSARPQFTPWPGPGTTFTTAKPERQLVLRAQSNGNRRSLLKRRRELSDVDGTDTGESCCKKRRLRRFLITSRLSQPFSLPASHVLNREALVSGKKRSLKVAAVINARRLRERHTAAGLLPPPETLWRAALANRFRKRILTDMSMGRSLAGVPMLLMNRARLIMMPMPADAGMAGHASGMPAGGPVPIMHMNACGIPVRVSVPVVHVNAIGMPMGISVPMNASGVPLGIPVPVMQMIAQTAMVKSPMVSAPPEAQSVMLPTVHMDFVDSSSISSSSSSSAQPEHDEPPSQSLELHRNGHEWDNEVDYPRPSFFEDEIECAFPTTEHESRYEVNDYDDDDNRPDDEVYADFSVLFGSSSDDTTWGSEREEGVDDWVNELDNIGSLST